MMPKNPAFPSVVGGAPAYFAERTRVHVRERILAALAAFFAIVSIVLAVALLSAPARDARYYVPEARADAALPLVTEESR